MFDHFRPAHVRPLPSGPCLSLCAGPEARGHEQAGAPARRRPAAAEDNSNSPQHTHSYQKKIESGSRAGGRGRKTRKTRGLRCARACARVSVCVRAGGARARHATDLSGLGTPVMTRKASRAARDTKKPCDRPAALPTTRRHRDRLARLFAMQRQRAAGPPARATRCSSRICLAVGGVKGQVVHRRDVLARRRPPRPRRRR